MRATVLHHTESPVAADFRGRGLDFVACPDRHIRDGVLEGGRQAQDRFEFQVFLKLPAGGLKSFGFQLPQLFRADPDIRGDTVVAGHEYQRIVRHAGLIQRGQHPARGLLASS